MKKLLKILLLTEAISVNCLPIINCKQETKVSNNLITNPAVHNPTYRWVLGDIAKKLCATKMHLILVQKFGEKDAVIIEMKRIFYDASIFRCQTEFDGEIDLYDTNSNTLIDSKNQNLITNLATFCVKAVLKCFNEKRFVSFSIQVVSKQGKLMLEAEKKLNEKNIEIYVKAFKNKQLVIEEIKKSLAYKQNIIKNNIELVNDFVFIDCANDIVTNDNEFWNGRVITVKANFKYNNHDCILRFKIIIKQEEISKVLDEAKSAIEILYIELSVLENKNELIRELEENINKQIGNGVTLEKNSLKVYEKSSDIEITDKTQYLIKDGCEVKVKLELKYKNESLFGEFNGKILNLSVNSLDKLILQDAKEKFENTLFRPISPLEIKNVDDVRNEIENSSFYKQIMKNGIELVNKIMLYDYDTKILINHENQHLFPESKYFRVELILKRNLEKLLIQFNVEIVSKQVKFMLEAGKKLNEKNIEIYVEAFRDKLLVIKGIKKSFAWKQNIIENGINLFDEFKFSDSSNTITNDNEFSEGRVLAVKALLEFDNEFCSLKFKIILKEENIFCGNNIWNKIINWWSIRLLILKNKFELPKQLEEHVNKQIDNNVSLKEECLEVNEKNNSDIEITNTNQLSATVVVNSTLVSSCEFNYDKNINNNDSLTSQETIFILDLDDTDNKDPVVLSRGWKGTLLDSNSINKFLNSNYNSYTSFDNDQSEFIKKFTRALHLPASKEASKKFDNFLNQKRFLTFDDLVNTINNHNLSSGENSYIDVPLEIIRDQAIQPGLFEETMLKIYNTLSSFFGKNYGYRILRTLAIVRTESGESDTFGVTKRNFWNIFMKVNEQVIKTNPNESSYKRGWISVPNMFSTFVHEFGHVIDFFHKSSFGFHESIDDFSGLNNKYSFKANAHNEYKQKYCDSCEQNKINCPYKISTTPPTNINRSGSNQKDYSLDQTEALIDFILKKVKNLKIPGKTAATRYEFTQEMLLRILINSNYGRTKLAEVHAEGFAYWLLAPENERTKAWEIWNEFFLDYLPKLRAAIPYFNDYLEKLHFKI